MPVNIRKEKDYYVVEVEVSLLRCNPRDKTVTILNVTEEELVELYSSISPIVKTIKDDINE